MAETVHFNQRRSGVSVPCEEGVKSDELTTSRRLKDVTCDQCKMIVGVMKDVSRAFSLLR